MQGGFQMDHGAFNEQQDFCLDMDLEEDIGAEIEDLLLYSRLGLEEEALTIVDEALWNHLDKFPVFAEVALYLVWKIDLKRLEALRAQIEDAQISFEDKDEQNFLSSVMGLGEFAGPVQDKDDSTEAALTGQIHLSENPNIVQIHRFLIGIRSVTSEWFRTLRGGGYVPRFLIDDAVPKVKTLARRGMLWEATLVFSHLCETASIVSVDAGRELKQAVQTIWESERFLRIYGLDEEDEEDDLAQLCRLEGTLAFMELLLTYPDDWSPPELCPARLNVDKLLKRSCMLTSRMFEKLPDSSARGKTCLFLEEVEKYLRDPAYGKTSWIEAPNYHDDRRTDLLAGTGAEPSSQRRLPEILSAQPLPVAIADTTKEAHQFPPEIVTRVGFGRRRSGPPRRHPGRMLGES